MGESAGEGLWLLTILTCDLWNMTCDTCIYIFYLVKVHKSHKKVPKNANYWLKSAQKYWKVGVSCIQDFLMCATFKVNTLYCILLPPSLLLIKNKFCVYIWQSFSLLLFLRFYPRVALRVRFHDWPNVCFLSWVSLRGH